MKPPLLFLCHRIPYPPNKGDKIRSYHLLKYLSRFYDLFLGGFIDDPVDFKHVSTLDEFCKETNFVELNPKLSRIKSLFGLLTGEALTLPYYRSKQLQNWVKSVAKRHSIDKLIVYSSAMAQYATYKNNPFDLRIIDFVDIDSDKWKQYAQTKKWPMNWVYNREADLLLNFERKIANDFDASFFVSRAEAEMFKSLSQHSAPKVDFYSNGVDVDFFDPRKVNENPYSADAKPIVFTGAMDYWPNIDAVIWFSESVLPKLIEQNPKVRFYIVGGKPSDAVLKLAENPNIVVTGRVEDIRPYIKYSAVAVAPMRIARGIQNKVLEAMAMECAVVSSPQGYEGIEARVGGELLIADQAQEWVKKITDILASGQNEMGKAARMRVMDDYSWDGSLSRLNKSFDL
ncbi:MAG: TIGR03087 family PEP-CTERM/XrtA system glycosyltransferase [Sedimenticola sp.]